MKNLLLVIGFLILGVVIGFFIPKGNGGPEVKAVQDCNADYKYINPRFGCGTEVVIKKHGYLDLQDKISRYIDEEKKNGVVESVSVYFRDLENGPSFGINEHERFIPASLFKLPIMFAYYLLVDDENFDLSTQIAYGEKTPSDPSKQFFPPKEEAKPHVPYTIDELIYRMIAYSDNKATAALVSDLNNLSRGREEHLMIETYNATGIVYPDTTTDAVITTKSYSSLFRILYNSSFLSIEMSDKALKILSESEFKQGLVKGVPEGTIVAHKFGERFDENVKEDVEQFHDCGIIYYPKNPYLLCIMTKGKYIPTLVGLTANISKMVYEEIDSRKL